MKIAIGVVLACVLALCVAPAVANDGSVAKFDFRGKIRKSALGNSMTYRCQNSRK